MLTFVALQRFDDVTDYQKELYEVIGHLLASFCEDVRSPLLRELGAKANVQRVRKYSHSPYIRTTTAIRHSRNRRGPDPPGERPRLPFFARRTCRGSPVVLNREAEARASVQSESGVRQQRHAQSFMVSSERGFCRRVERLSSDECEQAGGGGRRIRQSGGWEARVLGDMNAERESDAVILAKC
ncbi:hypothetical protein ACRALDRAFT_1083822 [Sodiomyces alcalophilus JCM 7366]|uniref:uncharacterized protein n=1 Tax=Sodiomyces alcalophilus JCM 7366 TaxID=591952 RepID=UPI0039B5D3A8